MIKQFLKHKNQFWLLVAMLVAFALRVSALSAQSLWNDEGTSVALSQLSLEAITSSAARDIHPPLYYNLLHFWMPFVGTTEYAVRFLSVIAGVLTVAVTFRIAYVFFDEEVAIIAAYLTAFSPFQIYYSQEARMYIWVTLWAAVSAYAMTMMFQREVRSQKSEVRNQVLESDSSLTTKHYPLPTINPRTERSLYWMLYIVSTIALLYTQYVGAFIVMAENIAFVVWFVLSWRDKRPTVWHSVLFWVAAQIVAGLAFLPWYLYAGGQLAAWPSISEPLDLPTLLWRVLGVFSIGVTMDITNGLLIAIAFGVLFALGWQLTRSANANWVIVTLILWTLVPVAIMYIVSLSRPAYNPKFLLLATPPFFILVARGFSTIYPGLFLHRRRYSNARSSLFPLYFTMAVLVSMGPFASLRNNYFDSQYARDDYRAILQFIDANVRDGDSILVNAPGQIDVVRYYHRGNQMLFLLPRMRPPDVVATCNDVDAILAQTKRMFAIYYATQQSDPQNIIESRLAEYAFKARDEWHGNVRLAIYGVAPNPGGAVQPIGARVGDEITLVDYRLDQHEGRAGDVLTLTLNWLAEQAPSTRYKVFVHLLDAGGKVVAQRDGEPVSDTRITTTWRSGEITADNYGVFIEPGTPPGSYQIEIGMYRVEDGVRLRVGNDDHLILGIVQVK